MMRCVGVWSGTERGRGGGREGRRDLSAPISVFPLSLFSLPLNSPLFPLILVYAPASLAPLHFALPPPVIPVYCRIKRACRFGGGERQALILRALDNALVVVNAQGTSINNAFSVVVNGRRRGLMQSLVDFSCCSPRNFRLPKFW
jgi:hypothetical protein